MGKWWQDLRAALKTAFPTRQQPIRLVVEELEDRRLLSGGLAPNVTYHGGPLLQNVQIENVYYGQPWTSDTTLKTNISQTDTFLKYFVTSPYMDVLQQYNVGSGSFLNKDDVVNLNPTNNAIDDTQIRQLIDGEITTGHVAATGPNQLYIFYTAPGVVVTADGQSSATDFAGYHDTFTNTAGATVYYAVIPYPSGGIGVGLTAFQQETIVLSHEVAEAVTDPDTQTGWFDSRYGEIGDLANGQYGLLNNYVVSGVWSQSAGQVVLPGPATTTGLQVSGVPIAAIAGQSTTTLVATITNTPAGATTSTYKATIDWGNGTTSAGTLTTDPNGGFDVVGTNTYAASGTFAVTVSINDTTNTLVGSVLTKAKVAAAAPTVLVTGTLFSATAGQAFTGTVATFIDSSSTAALANYTATIDWGDGTTSTGTVATGSGGTFLVSGSHTYASTLPAWVGSVVAGKREFVVSVTVNDTTTNTSATALSLATVTPAVPVIAANGVNIAAVSGQPFTGVVATFTTAIAGAVAGDFTATINWGNGTSSAGTVSVNPSGGFQVTGTNTYSTSSYWWGFGHGGRSFLITVAITDTKTQDQAKTTSTATVAATAANLTVSAQNIKATVGQSFAGTVATFTDTNTSLTATNFTATINWGDGTTTAGTISVDPNGGFDVIGTHTYATASTAQSIWGQGGGYRHGGLPFGPGSGTFPLSVTVASTSTSDTGSSQGSALVSPAVPDVQASGTLISAVFGQSFSGTVATFTTQLSVTGWTVTINWGDGRTSAGTIVAAAGGYAITGTHTYGNPAFGGWSFSHSAAGGSQPFLVSVTINDTPDNSSATTVSLASVTTTSPRMVATPVNLTLGLSTAFSGTVATFTDSDAAGTAAFSATINWGDGTSSAGAITANPSGPGWLVGSTHTYSRLGNYLVYVRIVDADGNSAVSLGKAAVTNNPSFGALTGVALTFLRCVEYETQIITRDYQQLLGRTPSSAEIGGWISYMQTGASDKQLMAGFLSSAEFYARSGNNNAGWLTALYVNVLNRTPDAVGQNGWMQNLAAGGTFSSVALAFVNSQERESVLVQNYYQQLLNRRASASEVALWTNLYTNGMSDAQINANFLASQEYFQNHNSDPATWLRGAYGNLLARSAVQSEIDGWLAFLGVA